MDICGSSTGGVRGLLLQHINTGGPLSTPTLWLRRENLMSELYVVRPGPTKFVSFLDICSGFLGFCLAFLDIDLAFLNFVCHISAN